jgi:hypothetical protein
MKKRDTQQITYTGISTLLLLATIPFFQSCEDQPSEKVFPSAGCEVAWTDSTTVKFVEQLELATKDGHRVWKDYKLGDGAVVLHPGKSADSTECLGLWQNGRVTDYFTSEQVPKLATSLYGYYLNFDDVREGYENPLTAKSQQPEAINQWLTSHGVKSAVLMPTDFPQFPFEIPALKKMQLAIHEAFHVEVMIRYWYTGKGDWPAWDEQPDRRGLQNCYNTSDTLKQALNAEKGQLIALIEFLLDNDKSSACQAGEAFLRLREARYSMLTDVAIDRPDGTQCDCPEAENIMELEEGLADYASWTMLYDMGLSTREELIKRYNAIQNEPFYLTGAMLMHAIALMNDGNTTEIIEEITSSANQAKGALLPIFKRELADFCAGN